MEILLRTYTQTITFLIGLLDQEEEISINPREILVSAIADNLEPVLTNSKILNFKNQLGMYNLIGQEYNHSLLKVKSMKHIVKH